MLTWHRLKTWLVKQLGWGSVGSLTHLRNERERERGFISWTIAKSSHIYIHSYCEWMGFAQHCDGDLHRRCALFSFSFSISICFLLLLKLVNRTAKCSSIDRANAPISHIKFGGKIETSPRQLIEWELPQSRKQRRKRQRHKIWSDGGVSRFIRVV